MAHSIQLYNTADDPRVVGKSKSAVGGAHSITLKDGCSIDEPTVSLTISASAIANANYAYIGDFGRYYWIRDRKSLINGVVELLLESDPWESFASQLRGCPATIVRNENRANGYLLDNAYQTLAYNTVVTRQFPLGLWSESMILMTVG